MINGHTILAVTLPLVTNGYLFFYHYSIIDKPKLKSALLCGGLNNA